MESIRFRKSRWSYAAEAVPREKIDLLFEAARWAPSSCNEQPWFYIYGESNTEVWRKIFNSLLEGNRIWAKRAPILIASLTRKNFSFNGQENPSSHYDLGQANAFLSLQATELGLNVHQIAGYDKTRLLESLAIPGEFDAGVILAVGYPGNEDDLPENLRLREAAPRNRKSHDEFVRNQCFGN